ncbi:hypothetical protein [Halopseudomonas pertucinogena]|uniref:UrcA family protein n=1 Tax=Halopseudomonas pertucinogena TaxID=86175 RepID=A0ABQ2CIY8_9GAMM|nr:hypothetical protein [Halopseudomonas pertucinogena]GGI91614.1 hypothetical protein GCM10009083_05020 [Halopseudomonas pertucinogena]
MRKLAVLLLLIGAPLAAEERQKPIATQVGEAIQPAAQAISRSVNNTVLEYMAASEGPLGQGARTALESRARQEAIANRGPRRNMKDCIKPDSVIDDDVKECMEGTRQKTW